MGHPLSAPNPQSLLRFRVAHLQRACPTRACSGTVAASNVLTLAYLGASIIAANVVRCLRSIRGMGRRQASSHSLHSLSCACACATGSARIRPFFELCDLIAALVDPTGRANIKTRGDEPDFVHKTKKGWALNLELCVSHADTSNTSMLLLRLHVTVPRHRRALADRTECTIFSWPPLCGNVQ